MYTMSVKCNYDNNHLIWAAYMLLTDKEYMKYAQWPLNKKSIRDKLREQIAVFGSDEYSLFGEDYSSGNYYDMESYNKAKEWVESRKWDK